jgi:hypothetical protein
MIGYAQFSLPRETSPVGNITIQDFAGNWGSLETARAYVTTAAAGAIISNDNFAIDTYRFSVPKDSDFSGIIDFLANDNYRFLDPFGYIINFSDNFLNYSTSNNVIGDNCTFGGFCFSDTRGDNIIGYNASFGASAFNNVIPKYKNIIKSIRSCGEDCFNNYNGVLEIHGDIGTTDGQDFPSHFFRNGTKAIIVVRKSKQTSNGGFPDGDLQTAIANGATVLYLLP